jgi:hypothetical protein
MSEKEMRHIADLTKTFDNMSRNGLKLNLEKCIFGIRKGQLLGCMVSKRGIQANPQKIEALCTMQPPSSRKGRAKTDGQNRITEQIHLQGSSTKPSLLQSASCEHNFSVGCRTVESLRRSEKLLGRGCGHVQAIPKGRPIVVHRCNRHSSQRRPGRGTNGGRHFEAIPHLLCLRSLKRFEALLLRNGEDGIHSRNGQKEASTLFSEPQRISTHRIPPSRLV